MAETRFEKFKKYREQIQNKNELTKIFVTEEDQVTEYKEIINRLSPNILVDLPPIHLNFLNFTSVDKSSRREIVEIRNFIDGFDFDLLTKIRDAANHIICQSSDDLNEEFEKNWVTNDRGWIILRDDPAFKDESANTYLEFKEKLPDGVSKLKDLVNLTLRSKELDHLSKVSVDFKERSVNLNQRKKYFAALIASGIFGLVAVMLAIVILAVV